VRNSCKSILQVHNNMLTFLLVICCCAASFVSVSTYKHPHAEAKVHGIVPMVGGRSATRWLLKDPPTDAGCRAERHQPCYSPQEMRNIYGVTPLINQGLIGTGQTIVIIDSFGSPDPLKDLKQFDADYGLPDPPSFKVFSPLGTVPLDKKNDDQMGWAQETNLDIQWAHVMAPGASLVLLTSPVSETQGLQGIPEFLKLEQYAIDHNLGKVFSQSWGTTEETLFMPEGKKMLDKFNAFFQNASKHQKITFITASGDAGTLNPDVNNHSYPFPTVGFPANSPWVTTVGGTSLYADTNGTYQSEKAWNKGIGAATGGGYSQYFRAPGYQQKYLPKSFQTVSKGYRGLPDVAYNADSETSIPVYLSFMPDPGYYLFGGTSAGAPQWAGIIADANQRAGHPLGFLNESLYKIGHNASIYKQTFHDIVKGDNKQGSVPGYNASIGWDAVTGWGTPKADALLPYLVNPPR
jgi:subtilase family serine protease